MEGVVPKYNWKNKKHKIRQQEALDIDAPFTDGAPTVTESGDAGKEVEVEVEQEDDDVDMHLEEILFKVWGGFD